MAKIRQVAIGKRGKVSLSLSLFGVSSAQTSRCLALFSLWLLPTWTELCLQLFSGWTAPGPGRHLEEERSAASTPVERWAPKRTPRSSRPEAEAPRLPSLSPLTGPLPHRHLFRADTSGAVRCGRLWGVTALPTGASVAGLLDVNQKPFASEARCASGPAGLSPPSRADPINN